MILWVKRAAAVWSAIFLVTLFYGHREVAFIGVILNFAWVVDEKLPPTLCRFIRSTVLVTNTLLSAYGALNGGPTVCAMFVAAGSLLSWNAGLFLQRWCDAPLDIQYRYLKRVFGTVALGLGAGLSALALQGHISLGFPVVLVLMLVAGILWLRLISRVSR